MVVCAASDGACGRGVVPQAAEARAIRSLERQRRTVATQQAAVADQEAGKAAAVISAAHEGQLKAVRRLRAYQTTIQAKLGAAHAP
jgi:hypothetical protein